MSQNGLNTIFFIRGFIMIKMYATWWLRLDERTTICQSYCGLQKRWWDIGYHGSDYDRLSTTDYLLVRASAQLYWQLYQQLYRQSYWQLYWQFYWQLYWQLYWQYNTELVKYSVSTCSNTRCKQYTLSIKSSWQRD